MSIACIKTQFEPYCGFKSIKTGRFDHDGMEYVISKSKDDDVFEIKVSRIHNNLGRTTVLHELHYLGTFNMWAFVSSILDKPMKDLIK